MYAKNQNCKDGWSVAVNLWLDYVKNPQKASNLLELIDSEVTGMARRQAQFLFSGALRHRIRLEQLIFEKAPRGVKPRPGAVLMIALTEILLSEAQRHPKIVHAATDKMKAMGSPAEAKFVHALLRNILRDGFPEVSEHLSLTTPEKLSLFYSHPLFLVERWLNAFGWDNTKQLLEWNQTPAETWLRVITQDSDENHLTSFATPSDYPNFWRVNRGQAPHAFDFVQQGKGYIQDPSTAYPVSIAEIAPGMNVLELCASPGGKSLQILEALQGKGTLVALDLPDRIKRLEENLTRSSWTNYHVLSLDALKLTQETLFTQGLPTAFDLVAMDAPCSNTGVLQRRPDAKSRLTAKAIEAVVTLQQQLIESAVHWVKPEGAFLYSTCSIEADENEGRMEALMSTFTQVAGGRHFPWETGHDGGGAFLMRKA